MLPTAVYVCNFMFPRYSKLEKSLVHGMNQTKEAYLFVLTHQALLIIVFQARNKEILDLFTDFKCVNPPNIYTKNKGCKNE